MAEGDYRQTVYNCPRCGGEHPHALWTPLPKPRVFLDQVFTHSAICPATIEPLFMETRIR